MNLKVTHHNARFALWTLCAALCFGQLSTFAQINNAGDEQRPRDPQMILLEHARNTLVDAVMRREALESLLDQGDPHVVNELAQALGAGGDVVFQRVIAQAVSRLPGRPPQALAQPMLALLQSANDPLAGDLGLALGRYDDDGVVNTLMDAARDTDGREAHRLAAIRGLSLRRTPRTANLLMKLAGEEKPQSIRRAALEAMAQLTGNDRMGDDPAAWNQWWREHRLLNQQRWYAVLAENFAAQSRRLAVENQQIHKRLLETQRQLYHATKEEKREPLLASMLVDPGAATRRLAIELSAQRFIDGKAFGAELTVAAIGALDDASVAVRVGAARLLLDLNNPDAADVMARRLVDGSETAPQVLRVYLLMMANRPHARAIDRAMALLAEPALRDHAAGVLASAAQRDLLTEQQEIHLHTQLQRVALTDRPPKPQVIELLGYVGDDADWQRIEQWLDSEQNDVKLAATRAWARSDRPMEALARRAADPAVHTIFIAAANSRGNTPQTLFALVRNKPESDHSIAAWQRAVAAVAQRISPAQALAADQMIVELELPIEHRELVLSAALGAALPPAELPGAAVDDAAVLVDLLLARADVRLQSGEPKTALNDLEVIETRRWPVTQQQAARRDALVMAARLLAGEHSEAFTVAADVLERARESGGDVYRQAATVITRLVLEAAGRHVKANQPDEALFLLTQLRETVGDSLPKELIERLGKLESEAGKLLPVKTAGSDNGDEGS